MFILLNIIIIVLTFLFGLCIGSFLNVVIFRLYEKRKLTGRSSCPNCGHTLVWYDLIPVFSFLFLKGKCRYCNQKISIQYPMVEFLTAVLFVLILIFRFYEASLLDLQLNLLLIFIRDVILVCSLIVIFVYDVRYMEIPDELTIPTIAIMFLFNFFIFKDLSNIFLGATLGTLFFLIQFLSSKGNWVGGGDIRMGLLMGVLFGGQGVLIAIFISYLLGTIYSLPLIFKKYINKDNSINSKVPFGPFLAIGTMLFIFISKFL